MWLFDYVAMQLPDELRAHIKFETTKYLSDYIVSLVQMIVSNRLSNILR